MTSPAPEYVLRSQLPVCCGGEAPCPYHDEVLQLRQLVITDPLTGLYNVRHFRAVLEQEMERTDRTGMPTALMMIDLDHFKQLNDGYGHESGNDVLKQVARRIRESTRKLDVQCRYGGEEFAVVLPSTERALAIMVAQRLRSAIAAAPVFSAGQELAVTASVGLAFYENGLAWDSRRLIAEADQFLYQAKQQGRNQVCYREETLPSSAVTSEEKDLLRDLFAGSFSDDD